MNKETNNDIKDYFKFFSGCLIFVVAWVSLPDQVCMNYADITRECTSCSLR